MSTNNDTLRAELRAQPCSTLIPTEDAKRIAAQLTANDEDGWTYEHDPVGFATNSMIKITDEDGDFLGYL